MIQEGQYQIISDTGACLHAPHDPRAGAPVECFKLPPGMPAPPIYIKPTQGNEYRLSPDDFGQPSSMVLGLNKEPYGGLNIVFLPSDVPKERFVTNWSINPIGQDKYEISASEDPNFVDFRWTAREQEGKVEMVPKNPMDGPAQTWILKKVME